MAMVEFNVSEFRKFFQNMEKVTQSGLRKELEALLEGAGNDFLRVLQDEILRRKVIDTRLLLSSFEKGSEGNVWKLSEGGLTLEVGTNVSYASYVNDGHWTNTKGVARRFVPGYWQGDRFIYDPTAKGGMLLKQHWVEGRHYFESALRIYEKLWKAEAEAKMQEWIDNYFGG